VPFVEMTDFDPEVEGLEEAPPGDAEDDLLQQADFRTASIERPGQATVGR
jgi:hypothetical protein